MREEIRFVKWKGLITKSIDDCIVWWHFEISTKLYEMIHKYVEKNLEIEIELNWNSILLDASINTDTKNYLSYQWDHWLVKLDILIKDILLAWYILKGNIFINLK
jgi:hypothetical protein